MGIILSIWRKKKPTTLELLEKLDAEIAEMEKLKRSNLEKQKKLIGSLLIYSVSLYIIAAVVFYFLYFPEKWPDRALYSSPLLVFPFIVWFLKRFLHWYFVKRISNNEGQLETLKEQRSNLLEEVMEKETYKKAREILEKFDPERFKALETPPSTPAPQRAPIGQELRQRKSSDTPGTNVPVGSVRPTPRVTEAPSASCPTTPAASHRMTQQQKAMAAAAAASAARGRPPPPGPPMPRPVLPRERGFLDRMVEYLVGDGPQNRYALICKNCYSHNGMALKEEFEYIAFRCCYCHTPNPSRKHRPSAPRLPVDTPGTLRRQALIRSSMDETNESDESDKSDLKPSKEDEKSAKSIKAEDGTLDKTD